MKETWRKIPDWDYYEVSDLGRVRSLDRKVVRNQAGVLHSLSIKGKVLHTPPNDNGYPHLTLSGPSGARSIKVHVLVLTAFRGPSSGRVGRHLNGNRTDNRLENLAWGTVKENEADKVRHGTSKRCRAQCPRGHSLNDPRNLRANANERHPRRRCLACARAQGKARHQREKFGIPTTPELIQQLSDEIYALLTTEVQAA